MSHLIEWKHEFELGIASVDNEHREMVELINTLFDDVAVDDEERVLEFLGEIYAKISAHFALEEKIMRERNYDQYKEHKHEHERLLDEILDIMARYESGELFNKDELSRILNAWFVDHFKTMDARLHSHLG
jgi:hemerythrin-like metal-binding protein